MSRMKSFTDDDDGAVSSASVDLENTPTVVKSDSELLRQARTTDEPAQPAYVLFLLSTSSLLSKAVIVFFPSVCLSVFLSVQKISDVTKLSKFALVKCEF